MSLRSKSSAAFPQAILLAERLGRVGFSSEGDCQNEIHQYASAIDSFFHLADLLGFQEPKCITVERTQKETAL